MINTKTKKKKSISEGNIVEEEECDSVTIVLMGVEIVQNLDKTWKRWKRQPQKIGE